MARFSASQAAKQLGVDVSTLKRWERLGWRPPVPRLQRNGHRIYSEEWIAATRAWMEQVTVEGRVQNPGQPAKPRKHKK